MDPAKKTPPEKTLEKTPSKLQNNSIPSDSQSRPDDDPRDPVQKTTDNTERTADASIGAKYNVEHQPLEDSQKSQNADDSSSSILENRRRSLRKKGSSADIASLRNEKEIMAANSRNDPDVRADNVKLIKKYKSQKTPAVVVKPRNKPIRNSKRIPIHPQIPQPTTSVIQGGPNIQTTQHSRNATNTGKTCGGIHVVDEEKRGPVLTTISNSKAMMDGARCSVLMQKAIHGEASPQEILYIREFYDALGSLFEGPCNKSSDGDESNEKYTSFKCPTGPIKPGGTQKTSTKIHNQINDPLSRETIDLTQSPNNANARGGPVGAQTLGAAKIASESNVNIGFERSKLSSANPPVRTRVQSNQYLPYSSVASSASNGGSHSNSGQLTSKRANVRIQKTEYVTRKLQKTVNELQQQLQSKTTSSGMPLTPPPSPAPLPIGPYGQIHQAPIYGPSTMPTPAWQYGYYAQPQIITQPSPQPPSSQLPQTQQLPIQMLPPNSMPASQMPNYSFLATQYAGYPSQYGYSPSHGSYGQYPFYPPRNP